ncbi:MAG: type II toxin-antitoxin system HigB family toxin [Pseudomonas putida]
MRVIAKRTLREFWDRYPDAETPLVEWFRHMERASYSSPQELKAVLHKASILKAGRAVFNVGGNKYRLVASIDYDRQLVYVKFVGTHAEYDAIDAESV